MADGLPHPISYYSKALTPAKRGYNVHDQELLAIIQGLKHWKHLLLGAKHPILVYMDHKNLQYYRMPQNITHWVARYLPQLMEYNLTLIHKPGKTMKADLLSRCPDYDDGKGDNKQVLVLSSTLFLNHICLCLADITGWDGQLVAAQLQGQDDIQ
jgi:RNase H-like domain found in reverse transcriptase